MNVVLVVLAIHFYPGRLLLDDPISYLGQVKSANGLSNTISSKLYGTDMAVSGCFMFILAVYYSKKNNPKNIFRTFVSLLGGIGFLIASVSPNDSRHEFHVLGSSFIVASLWLLATGHVYNLRNKLDSSKYLVLQLILQLPVFTYAITYFLNIDFWPSILQKFAITGLIITLLYSGWFEENGI